MTSDEVRSDQLRINVYLKSLVSFLLSVGYKEMNSSQKTGKTTSTVGLRGKGEKKILKDYSKIKSSSAIE
jgi:hypothetical protein